MARSFKILKKRAGRRGIIKMNGPLVAGSRGTTLPRHIRRLAVQGIRQVTLDLSRVPYIDCAGIGVLVLCREEARGHGVCFNVSGCRGPIRSMLAMSALLEPLAGGGPESARLEPSLGFHDPPMLLPA